MDRCGEADSRWQQSQTAAHLKINHGSSIFTFLYFHYYIFVFLYILNSFLYILSVHSYFLYSLFFKFFNYFHSMILYFYVLYIHFCMLYAFVYIIFYFIIIHTSVKYKNHNHEFISPLNPIRQYPEITISPKIIL